ncbi:MAG TPA: hypothetical protein VKI44_23345 [Acetobacteraceae bacterium]|nr:hypothetical protein [Acetobacteraceae bacterium]
MLAAAAESVSTQAPVMWFWFAPFKGVADQTIDALRQAATGLRLHLSR